MSEQDKKWQKIWILDVRNLSTPALGNAAGSCSGGDAWGHRTHGHAGNADVAPRGDAGVAPRTTAAMHAFADSPARHVGSGFWRTDHCSCICIQRPSDIRTIPVAKARVTSEISKSFLSDHMRLWVLFGQ